MWQTLERNIPIRYPIYTCVHYYYTQSTAASGGTGSEWCYRILYMAPGYSMRTDHIECITRRTSRCMQMNVETEKASTQWNQNIFFFGAFIVVLNGSPFNTLFVMVHTSTMHHIINNNTHTHSHKQKTKQKNERNIKHKINKTSRRWRCTMAATSVRCSARSKRVWYSCGTPTMPKPLFWRAFVVVGTTTSFSRVAYIQLTTVDCSQTMSPRGRSITHVASPMCKIY